MPGREILQHDRFFPQEFNAHEKHARHARTWPDMHGHASPCVSTRIHAYPRVSTRVQACPRMSTRVHACPRVSMTGNACTCVSTFSPQNRPVFPPESQCTWRMHAWTWRIHVCTWFLGEKQGDSLGKKCRHACPVMSSCPGLSAIWACPGMSRHV